MPAPLRVLRRTRYRVRQVVRGLRPALSPMEVGIARAHLTPAEFALFMGMLPRDRRHSMDLYHLLAAGTPPPTAAMLVAALLHDVGKEHLALWHRVAFVLLSALPPSIARRVETESGLGWRQALWRLRHHGQLGADVLERTGSSPRVIEIVRMHTHARSDDPEIEAFIRADDRV